jgi:hypothetical protein
MFNCPTNRRFSTDCSRTSGLKSSLNSVHLKIYHALKETSYLTDHTIVTVSAAIAITIGNYLSEGVGHRALPLPPLGAAREKMEAPSAILFCGKNGGHADAARDQSKKKGGIRISGSRHENLAVD